MTPVLHVPFLHHLGVADARSSFASPPAAAESGPILRIAARSSGKRLVFLTAGDVWAFEARERLVFVQAPQGRFDIDLPLGEVESSLGAPFLRVHRNWVVSLTKVRELRWGNGSMQLFAGGGISDESADRCGLDVPVARDRMKQVRGRLLAGTFGVRPAVRKGNAAGLATVR
jgi:DNA-binding LytR/AlgR family response regulator